MTRYDGELNRPRRAAKARLTPKQRVMKRYPKATASRWTALWHICIGVGVYIGDGRTAKEAWADAARRITGKK